MHFFRVIALASVVFLSFLVNDSSGSQAFRDRLMFADGLYARRMVELAQNEYKALLDEFPDAAEADVIMFRLAECFRLSNELEQAAALYSRIVVRFPDSPFRLRAAYRRARLYALEGDYESAEAHFRVILDENPPPDLAAAALYYLGETLLALDRTDEAETAFAAILPLASDGAFDAHALMQRAALRQKHWLALLEKNDPKAALSAEQARLFYEQALEATDDPAVAPEALFQLARLYYRMQDYEQSAHAYRRLIDGFPDSPRAMESLLPASWASMLAGRYAAVVERATAALDDPGKIQQREEWMYLLANAYRQLLQYTQTVEAYQTLLKSFPSGRFANRARYELALTRFQNGDFDGAIAEAEQIAMTDALRSDISWLLAESYAALERSAEAVQYYRIVVRESPGSDRARDALYRLALHLQKQGYYREASRFYLELLDNFPDDALAPQALFASAFCLSQVAADEDAVRDWRRFITDFPDHSLAEDALYQKAMGEIRLGRMTDANSSLRDLERRFPKGRFMADASYWQGKLLVKDGRYAEAELPLRRSLTFEPRDTLRLDIVFQLGMVLQQLGRHEEAAGLLQTLVNSPLKNRLNPGLLEWLAVWHASQEAYRDMLEAARLLTEREEPVWRQAGWVLLGRARLKLDMTTEASVAFQQALTTDKVTKYAAEAAFHLGEYSLQNDALDKAVTYFEKASQWAQDEAADAIVPRSLLGLGRAALQDGRDQDASRYFLSVSILYEDADNVPESLYMAAKALERLERHQDQQKTLEELHERYPDSPWSHRARERW